MSSQLLRTLPVSPEAKSWQCECALRGPELGRPEGKAVTQRTHGKPQRLCTDEIGGLESIIQVRNPLDSPRGWHRANHRIPHSRPEQAWGPNQVRLHVPRQGVFHGHNLKPGHGLLLRLWGEGGVSRSGGWWEVYWLRTTMCQALCRALCWWHLFPQSQNFWEVSAISQRRELGFWEDSQCFSRGHVERRERQMISNVDKSAAEYKKQNTSTYNRAHTFLSL